jgi:hypothetical protein
MTRVNTISQNQLQFIFDVNGLDAYSATSPRLNHDRSGDVIIDQALISYCAPWQDVVVFL